jgi:hypothetical protein
MKVVSVLYIGIVVGETAPFQADAKILISEDELSKLIDFLALNPESGEVIPGAGGVRKLRWAMPGRGKRGGARVIYFYADDTMPLYLIAIFAKSAKTDLDAEEKAEMRNLVKLIVCTHRTLQKKAV